jgi:hypothetical protein
MKKQTQVSVVYTSSWCNRFLKMRTNDQVILIACAQWLDKL